MKKIDLLKELLRINIDNMNFSLALDMKIEFDNNEFIVKIKNIEIFKDELLNYDLDFEDQKKFILNVGNKIFRFFEIKWPKEYEKIDVDNNVNLLRIVGYNYYMFKNYTIEINKEKMKKCADIDSDEEFKKCLEKIFKKIAFNLDWNKIDVVYDLEKKQLYINSVIYHNEITVKYIDERNSELLQFNTNSLLYSISENDISVCYSEVDEKEARKAFKYIKKLIYN